MSKATRRFAHPDASCAKSIQELLVSRYVYVMREYMRTVNESSQLNDISSQAYIINNGIYAIHRVFEYVLLKYQSLDKAVYYSKKTCYYYLEYMQQVADSNLSHNLNSMDAMLFVYKKTIFDMNDGDADGITNMMSFDQDSAMICIEDATDMLKRMLSIIHSLLHWENSSYTLVDRQDICDQFLERFCISAFRLGKNMEYTYSVVEMIQQKIEMGIEDYKNILVEILCRIEKKRVPADSGMEKILQKFYVEDITLFEKFDRPSKQEFVQWLYA
jgi:hypothetical protein